MTQLTGPITADQTLIPVTPALANGAFNYPLYFTIDDEAIMVTGRAVDTTWLVNRGVAGTTRNAHASGTALIRYEPDAPGGGATPTLAEVLAEGNVPSGPIVGADGTGGTGGRLVINDAFNDFGGGVSLTGGVSATGNGAFLVVGGGGYSGDVTDGGDIVLSPGGTGGGRAGLVFLNLPTSDPGVADALWSDGGVVTQSAG